jgi:hypothetical protein
MGKGEHEAGEAAEVGLYKAGEESLFTVEVRRSH